jgi:pimeloyl-ACP methyl ester carboxylesterase
MTDTIVLLHGGATGSSWNAVARSLVSSGARVFAPDMLGYGASPAPTGSCAIAEEVAHLTRLLGLQPHSCNGTTYAVGFGGTFHLVTHSLGSLIGLHLRRALGARVTRMTLVDPVVVSVLRECGEDDAYAEMAGAGGERAARRIRDGPARTIQRAPSGHDRAARVNGSSQPGVSRLTKRKTTENKHGQARRKGRTRYRW